MIKGICELCKKDKVGHIHHKNLVHSDNNKKNLMYLCPDCHRLIHHCFIPAMVKEYYGEYDGYIDFSVDWRLKPKYRNIRMICWLKKHFKFNEIIEKPYIFISKYLKKLIFALIMEEVIINRKIENSKKINKFLEFQTFAYNEDVLKPKI